MDMPLRDDQVPISWTLGRGFTLKAFNVDTTNAFGQIIICTFHRNLKYNNSYKSDPENDEIALTYMVKVLLHNSEKSVCFIILL